MGAADWFMGDVEEKRVFDERTGKTDMVVAADVGVLHVEVAADRLGRFGVTHRCTPTDVAASAGHVAVATDEDVLHHGPDDDAFEQTGFGPAVAVGFADGPVAAGPGGTVSAWSAGSWAEIGSIDADVRAIDPPLLAAADGVYRLPGLDAVGLDDAYDVAAAGPLAATAAGLYSLGNGWMDELDGAFRVVGVGPDWAHAATGDAVFERADGSWGEASIPPTGAPVVDVAYGDCPYAVTADGTLLAHGPDGWRAHLLGVEGVVGCAVV